MLSIFFQYWWVLAIISGLGLTVRNIMFKIGSGHMDAALGALILSLSMSFVAIGYYIWDRMNKDMPVISTDIDGKGALCAVIAGAGVAGANIFLAHSYKVGGPASLVAVLQNGFSISVTILIGMLVLGEAIRPLQALGILCAFAGIVMIARG